jgi:hypothetical protein
MLPVLARMAEAKFYNFMIREQLDAQLAKRHGD